MNKKAVNRLMLVVVIEHSLIKKKEMSWKYQLIFVLLFSLRFVIFQVNVPSKDATRASARRSFHIGYSWYNKFWLISIPEVRSVEIFAVFDKVDIAPWI
jgi:hypothetical protein